MRSRARTSALARQQRTIEGRQMMRPMDALQAQHCLEERDQISQRQSTIWTRGVPGQEESVARSTSRDLDSSTRMSIVGCPSIRRAVSLSSVVCFTGTEGPCLSLQLQTRGTVDCEQHEGTGPAAFVWHSPQQPASVSHRSVSHPLVIRTMSDEDIATMNAKATNFWEIRNMQLVK